MYCLMGFCIIFSACSKKSNPTPPAGLGGLVATWQTTSWGGIANDDLSFVVSSGSTTALVSEVGTRLIILL